MLKSIKLHYWSMSKFPMQYQSAFWKSKCWQSVAWSQSVHIYSNFTIFKFLHPCIVFRPTPNPHFVIVVTLHLPHCCYFETVVSISAYITTQPRNRKFAWPCWVLVCAISQMTIMPSLIFKRQCKNTCLFTDSTGQRDCSLHAYYMHWQHILHAPNMQMHVT